MFKGALERTTFCEYAGTRISKPLLITTDYRYVILAYPILVTSASLLTVVFPAKLGKIKLADKVFVEYYESCFNLTPPLENA